MVQGFVTLSRVFLLFKPDVKMKEMMKRKCFEVSMISGAQISSLFFPWPGIKTVLLSPKRSSCQIYLSIHTGGGRVV